MSACVEDFEVLCVHVPDGIRDSEMSAIRDSFVADEPDFWALFQPDTILMFFRSKKRGALRAAKAKERVSALKDIRPLRFGLAKGPLAADIPWFGRISQIPLGEAANQAQHAARSEQPGR